MEAWKFKFSNFFSYDKISSFYKKRWHPCDWNFHLSVTCKNDPWPPLSPFKGWCSRKFTRQSLYYGVLSLSTIYWYISIETVLKIDYLGFKAIGGAKSHFCMWRLDESSNCRVVNTFYGMKISCHTRKIWQFEFSGFHTFL